MKRTQIYLDEEIFDFLEKESDLEHKSISELIRESLYETMRNKANDLMKQTDKIFGIWKDKDFNVDEYIDDLRKDRVL